VKKLINLNQLLHC